MFPGPPPPPPRGPEEWHTPTGSPPRAFAEFHDHLAAHEDAMAEYERKREAWRDTMRLRRQTDAAILGGGCILMLAFGLWTLWKVLA